MVDSLDDVKKRLRRRYLNGKLGIHGLGISPSENSIKIYLHRDKNVNQKELLAKIEEEAAPYNVIAIFEEPPLLA